MTVSVAPRRVNDEAVLNTYIGQRIRMARISLGVSQQGLAARLGLTFQQVQKYERGRNRISASRLYDIARVLGISVETFYNGLEDGARGAMPSRMNDLTKAYEKLSPQFGARELVELNKAFVGIRSPQTRAQLIHLVELIADTEGAGKDDAAVRGAATTAARDRLGEGFAAERPHLPAKLVAV